MNRIPSFNSRVQLKSNYTLLSGLNSRQNSVLVVIIILCIIICIGLYFISVNNDYNDLQSFYFSFLERKSLICEGRMAHRQDLERMAPVQVMSCDIEGLQGCWCYCFVLTIIKYLKAADLHHQLDSNNMRSVGKKLLLRIVLTLTFAYGSPNAL